MKVQVLMVVQKGKLKIIKNIYEADRIENAILKNFIDALNKALEEQGINVRFQLNLIP
jgi:hypothetical protein